MNTPETTGYLILALSTAFGIMAVVFVRWWAKYRSLLKDEATLHELEN